MDKAACQELILKQLSEKETISDTKYFEISGNAVNQLELLGVLNGLKSRNMIDYESKSLDEWRLTKEGIQVLEAGSPEARVFNAIPKTENGIDMNEMTKLVGAAAKFGQGAAFKLKWISKTTDGKLIRLVDSVVDTTQADLKEIEESGNLSNQNIIKELKKRNFIALQKLVSFSVTKGPEFSLEVKKEYTEITAEMLASGEWKTAKFKKYNFKADGAVPKAGYLHPLLKVRDEFRQIFFELGFSEMPANKYIESSFWNFDALFQPQQHPARDAHDTFFLSAPEKTDKFPPEYLERVKQVHSTGGYGSSGYGYEWKIEEAQKLILRTHTTAISSNLLYKLAQEKEFRPVKWFSIDRVFRNETLDATHLAEFHQIEGVVADRGITLGDLMGVLHGIKNLRFKPAYNPYTEPSMEIFAWHYGLNKYVEIGNSGMFRPEVLLPMGLPPDVQVIAWGLSTERPTMIKYGLNNIRDLVGHKLDLEMVANNKMCRLDKD